MTAYRGPIIDAHHHFWEPELGRQPWLLPEASIPFRYGDYSSIKQRYLPPDLRRDAEGFNLVGSVTMETEWDIDDPVGEMRYTERIAARYGLPDAAVAHAVLREPTVAHTIEQLVEIPLVRSVRNKPGQAASPGGVASSPSLMMDPRWQDGYARLASTRLHFDLQVAWWHLHEAEDLAGRHPQQLMIINHAALPSDRSEEMLQGWASSVRSIARMPNTVMKVSGIGLPGVRWTVENNRRIVDTIAEAFGPDRMMFASNFPVDSLCATYQEIFGGFQAMTADWSPAEQLAAFAGTAARVYSLDRGLLALPTAPREGVGEDEGLV